MKTSEEKIDAWYVLKEESVECTSGLDWVWEKEKKKDDPKFFF